MIEVLIKIDTPMGLPDFARICSKCTGDVLVYSGRYMVSGKSFLDLYSLDLSNPLKVEFYGNIPDEVKEEMKKYIIEYDKQKQI